MFSAQSLSVSNYNLLQPELPSIPVELEYENAILTSASVEQLFKQLISPGAAKPIVHGLQQTYYVMEGILELETHLFHLFNWALNYQKKKLDTWLSPRFRAELGRCYKGLSASQIKSLQLNAQEKALLCQQTYQQLLKMQCLFEKQKLPSTTQQQNALRALIAGCTVATCYFELLMNDVQNQHNICNYKTTLSNSTLDSCSQASPYTKIEPANKTELITVPLVIFHKGDICKQSSTVTPTDKMPKSILRSSSFEGATSTSPIKKRVHFE